MPLPERVNFVTNLTPRLNAGQNDRHFPLKVTGNRSISHSPGIRHPVFWDEVSKVLPSNPLNHAFPLSAACWACTTYGITPRAEIPVPECHGCPSLGRHYSLGEASSSPPCLPYKHAFVILRQALVVARVGVIFKLRLSFLEPTKTRGTWLHKTPPALTLLLPRAVYRGRTCNVPEAWTIWHCGESPRSPLSQQVVFAVWLFLRELNLKWIEFSHKPISKSSPWS